MSFLRWSDLNAKSKSKATPLHVLLRTATATAPGKIVATDSAVLPKAGVPHQTGGQIAFIDQKEEDDDEVDDKTDAAELAEAQRRVSLPDRIHSTLNIRAN
jgi:hypothetical protein